MNADFFRTWIIPPVVGAIIGYFTNWLAIKMLFRPLREIRLWGIKLPFTPGILPRERYRLAESVGETVSKELLSTEVFASRLRDAAMREKIQEAVYGWLKTLLSADSGESLESVASPGQKPGPEEGGGKGGTLLLSEILRASATGIVNSEDFKKALEEALKKATVGVSRMKLGELISPKRAGEIAEIAAGKAKALSDDQVFDRFIDATASAMAERVPALIPESAVVPVLDIVSRTLYRSILPVVKNLLDSPAIRGRMNQEGLEMVHRTIQRLGPIQRLIVTAANYEASLAKSMPDTIDDLQETIMTILLDKSVSDRISEIIQTWFKASRSKADGKGEMGFDATGDSWTIQAGDEVALAGLFPLADTKRALKSFLAELDARGEDFGRSVEARFEKFAERPLGELFPDVEGMLLSSFEIVFASKPEVDAASSPAASDAADKKDVLGEVQSAFLLAFIDRIRGKSLGELLSLDGEKLESLAGIMTEALLAALSSQAEKLVIALDIRSMVVEKINALDMRDAERLIFAVVDKELEWITLLGGILGAIIGVFQSLISIL